MKKISVNEFDNLFDNGKDITEYLDTSKTMSVKDFEKKIKTKRINLDLPTYIIENIDIEAKKIGITRQALLKMWITERLNISSSTNP